MSTDLQDGTQLETFTLQPPEPVLFSLILTLLSFPDLMLTWHASHTHTWMLPTSELNLDLSYYHRQRPTIWMVMSVLETLSDIKDTLLIGISSSLCKKVANTQKISRQRTEDHTVVLNFFQIFRSHSTGMARWELFVLGYTEEQLKRYTTVPEWWKIGPSEPKRTTFCVMFNILVSAHE